MDIVDYSQETFESIRRDYVDFAARLELPDVHFMPISALKGDNVVTNSERMAWHEGPPLMHLLETVYIGSDRNMEDFRFPVQYVTRPNLDFRGFAGTVASGIIRKGDEISGGRTGWSRYRRSKFSTAVDGQMGSYDSNQVLGGGRWKNGI